VDRRANLDASYPALVEHLIWNQPLQYLTLIPIESGIWNVSSGVLSAAVGLYLRCVFHVCDAMQTTM
jgi:hypothetical protein